MMVTQAIGWKCEVCGNYHDDLLSAERCEQSHPMTADEVLARELEREPISDGDDR